MFTTVISGWKLNIIREAALSDLTLLSGELSESKVTRLSVVSQLIAVSFPELITFITTEEFSDDG